MPTVPLGTNRGSGTSTVPVTSQKHRSERTQVLPNSECEMSRPRGGCEMRHWLSLSLTRPKSCRYGVLAAAGVKVPWASNRPTKEAVSTTPESLT